MAERSVTRLVIGDRDPSLEPPRVSVRSPFRDRRPRCWSRFDRGSACDEPYAPPWRRSNGALVPERRARWSGACAHHPWDGGTRCPGAPRPSPLPFAGDPQTVPSPGRGACGRPCRARRAGRGLRERAARIVRSDRLVRRSGVPRAAPRGRTRTSRRASRRPTRAAARTGSTRVGTAARPVSARWARPASTRFASRAARGISAAIRAAALVVFEAPRSDGRPIADFYAVECPCREPDPGHRRGRRRRWPGAPVIASTR